jgi:hypothetical protein
MGASIAGVAAALALSACGSGAQQDAHELKRNYPVSVPIASFPARQHLADHRHLVIVVHNVGRSTIPNVAVTICNLTCAYPAPPGAGTNAQAFAANIGGRYLANSSRPVWIVNKAPGKCSYSCLAGGPGAGVTAYSNTWALGSLRPGRAVVFDWGVTAVSPGIHVVAWQVAAGLGGHARAVLANGSPPGGKFIVRIDRAPAQSFVNNRGQVVTTQ